MQISIPITPHIKPVLLHVFGPEPVQARKNSRLGRLLAGFLAQYPYLLSRFDEDPASDAPTRTELADDELADLLILRGDELRVDVSFGLRLEYLTDENLTRLGNWLEDLFEIYLMAFGEGRQRVMPSEQGAVKDFYQKFNIDTRLYDLDSAFKIPLRQREYINKLQQDAQKTTRPFLPQSGLVFLEKRLENAKAVLLR